VSQEGRRRCELLAIRCINICVPTTVAAQPKAWTIFPRSNAGILDSKHTQCMDVCVCVFLFCAVLCIGSGLATGWSLFQGVLTTAQKRLRNWIRDQGQRRPLMNKCIYCIHTVELCVYIYVIRKSERRRLGNIRVGERIIIKFDVKETRYIRICLYAA
jgi:hypothetical protein